MRWILSTLFLSLVVFVDFAACDAPSASAVEGYIKDRATETGSTYSDKKGEVEGNLKQWLKGDDPLYRYGNPAADSAFDFDTDWLKDEQTKSCNDADPPYANHHTYDNLHTQPKIEVCVGGGGEDDCDCIIHYKYDPGGSNQGGGSSEAGDCSDGSYSSSGLGGDGEGERIGICEIRINIYFCQPLCLRADLVEYLFPTQKINISDQMFHSRYLDQADVETAIPELQAHLELEGSNRSAQTIEEVYNNSKAKLTTPVLVSGENVDVSDDPSRAFLATDASEKAFSRHWGEEDIIEDHEWYLPHVKKELPIYSGDIEGYRLSYWLPESQFVNLELQSSGPFSGLGGSSSVNHYLDHLNNPQRCIRNNKHDGKTPSDFFIEGAEWGAQDADASETDIADWRCLDWIGEVNPYMAHHRRPHQTDGFFQRLISGLQAFHAYADSKDSGTSTSASSSSSSGGSSTGSVTEGEGRYTYRPDVDRLHLLPPNLAAPIPTQLTEKIRADLQHVTYPYQCNLLDELIQENYKYDTANIVDPGTAAETSVEMFTRFKGCWGFQGQATEMFPIHKMEKLSRFNYRENRTE